MTSEGPPERSDGGSSETSSGERGDPRDAADDIPLDITGHEDREPPRGSKRSREEGTDPQDGDRSGGSEPSPFGSDADAREDPDARTNGHTEDVELPDEDRADGESREDDEGAAEPVEVLVQLADDGEIDPWDIDVVEVTDKFLARIDEGDLRTGGRALFYASVLVRMKSDAMLGADEEEDPPAEPWEQAMTDDVPIEEPDPFAALESEMDRRLERRRARGMPQTLDELVRDLRDAERDSWWKESREYDTSDSPSGFQRGTQELDYHSADDLRMDDEPSAADVTGTAHAEQIDDIIDDVYAAVREQYDQGREEVLYREVEDSGGSRVETFLGLLFLAHRGQVHLQQDDVFGDLWIQDPSAVSGSGEAIAD